MIPLCPLTDVLFNLAGKGRQVCKLYCRDIKIAGHAKKRGKMGKKRLETERGLKAEENWGEHRQMEARTDG